MAISESELENIFRKYLGPMAISIFNDMKKEGLLKDRILEFIDGLEKDDILSHNDAAAFREDIDESF